MGRSSAGPLHARLPGRRASVIFVYRINDRQCFIRIGKTPAWSLDAARKRAKKLQSTLDQGFDPESYRREPEQVAPVENVIQYIADQLRAEEP